MEPSSEGPSPVLIAPPRQPAATAFLHVPWVLLWVFVGSFAAAWTLFGWAEYESFHLYVLDFGLIYQEMWALVHGLSPVAIGSEAVEPIVILFAPAVDLFPSQSGLFFFLLSFQSLFLALGAVPVYLLAAERLANRWGGLALALAYLGFPALSGLPWFPVHFQALFPTLFLFGYWFHRRGRWRPAAALWTFSLITNIGAPLVVAAFGVGMIAEPLLARTGLWNRLRRRPTPTPEPRPSAQLTRGAYLVAAAGVTFATIGAYLVSIEGMSGLLGFLLQTSANGTPSTGGPAGSLYNIAGRKFLTVLLLLGPLLVLPLWGREERWSTIPFFVHALVVGSPQAFLWPFRDQYTALVIPGLFAGLIRALDRPWGIDRSSRTPTPSPHERMDPRRRWRLPVSSPSKTAGLVLVAVAVVGSTFAAWGPLNPLLQHADGLSGGYYEIPRVTTVDPTVATGLRALIGATPTDGNILLQNNIVEPLDRLQFTIPGYYALSQPLRYALTDPYDGWFYTPNLLGPNPVTMWQWSNYLLANGWWVRGETQGSLLLAENGSGPPLVFQPLIQNFTRASTVCCGTTPVVGNVTTNATVAAGPSLPWVDQYSVWSPGVFELSLILSVDHPRPSDMLTLQLGYDGGALPLRSFSVNGSAWTAVNGTVLENFTWTVPVYFVGMHFALFVARWTGSLRFDQLSVIQTGTVGIEHLGPPWSNPPPNGTARSQAWSGAPPIGVRPGLPVAVLVLPSLAGLGSIGLTRRSKGR